MIEPNQGHVTRLLRRKSSFDEYQRRLVDKIKRHFERRRRQWEKNIENQVKSRNCEEDLEEEEGEEEEDEETLVASSNGSPYQTTSPENTTDSVTSSLTSPLSASPSRQQHPAKRATQSGFTCYASSSEIKNDANQISILSVEATDFPDEGKRKHTIMVNIQSFLPFGSVTVRQETNGLMLIGESNSHCSCRPRNRRESAKTYEKLVELEAAVENDSMVVHTTREGIMRIDVVTSLTGTTS